MEKIPLTELRIDGQKHQVTGFLTIDTVRGLIDWKAEIYAQTPQTVNALAQGLLDGAPMWLGFVAKDREYQGQGLVVKVNPDELRVLVAGDGVLYEYPPGTLL